MRTRRQTCRTAVDEAAKGRSQARGASKRAARLASRPAAGKERGKTHHGQFWQVSGAARGHEDDGRDSLAQLCGQGSAKGGVTGAQATPSPHVSAVGASHRLFSSTAKRCCRSSTKRLLQNVRCRHFSTRTRFTREGRTGSPRQPQGAPRAAGPRRVCASYPTCRLQEDVQPATRNTASACQAVSLLLPAVCHRTCAPPPTAP